MQDFEHSRQMTYYIIIILKTWSFLTKLNIHLPYDQATPLLHRYPKEGKAVTKTAICTTMFIAALFIIAKGSSNPSVY